MTEHWWQTAVIYQIYPRSFQDADGDGVGDLAGVIRRLPYLVELGVDALWLSPVFRSPMADFGYDISDYCDIDPLFGTLTDFDELLARAHALGLKVILDLVPNHTSDQHPWFVESRASRSSPKRDWYIWRDGATGGEPPNNWQSEFGGPAWEQDASGQYYYHAFLAAQPDLNWRNPNVRAAMYDVMRFWFNKGVDGFRIDVIWHLIKDEQFRDNPPNPAFQPDRPPHEAVLPLYTTDRPEIHDLIREMRTVTEEFAGRLLIGEIYLPIERLVAYYGRDLGGLHLPFNFALLSAPWQARALASLIDEYETALPQGGWPNWVLGNHDRPRIAGRVGPEQAKVAAMLLLTLRGTPTIYYGDEIGIEQVPIAPEQVRDPFERNVPGLGVGRDGCRTPMQWDASPNAGFSAQPPWLPLEQAFETRNVALQRTDEASIYHLHRKLITLRRTQRSLSVGSYRAVTTEGNLLLFVRQHDDERMLVALNLGNEPAQVTFVDRKVLGDLVLSTCADRNGEALNGSVNLRANEGAIFRLSAGSDLP
jgi:alpha-glucosidase